MKQPIGAGYSEKAQTYSSVDPLLPKKVAENPQPQIKSPVLQPPVATADSSQSSSQTNGVESSWQNEGQHSTLDQFSNTNGMSNNNNNIWAGKDLASRLREGNSASQDSAKREHLLKSRQDPGGDVNLEREAKHQTFNAPKHNGEKLGGGAQRAEILQMLQDAQQKSGTLPFRLFFFQEFFRLFLILR